MMVYRVYCGGFMSKIDGRQPVITYLDIEKFNGSNYELFDDVIYSIINQLLNHKYKDFKFYCHNLGGYNIIFVLGALLRYNDNNPEDVYKINCVFRDKKIIKITISKKINNVNRKTITNNSFSILASSQKKLCEAFDVRFIKLNFPYKFLFYLL